MDDENNIKQTVMRARHKKRLIEVIYPPNNHLRLAYDSTTLVCQLYQQVCNNLQLTEQTDLFALAQMKEDGFLYFLNPRSRLFDFTKKLRKSSKRTAKRQKALDLPISSDTPHEDTLSASSSHMAYTDAVTMSSISSHDTLQSFYSSLQQSDSLPMLHFTVQSYIPPRALRHSRPLHFYYEQIRQNQLRYPIMNTLEDQLELASLALQADFGDWRVDLNRQSGAAARKYSSLRPSNSAELSDDAVSGGGGCGGTATLPTNSVHSSSYRNTDNAAASALYTISYFKPVDYLPVWVIHQLGESYLLHHLPKLHADLVATPQSKAKFLYVRKAASMPSHYNCHLYQLNETSAYFKGRRGGSQIWLSVSPQGIGILEKRFHALASNLVQTSVITWNEIACLSLVGGCFQIELKSPARRCLKYRGNHDDATRHFLELSQTMHQLQTQALFKASITESALEEFERQHHKECYIFSSVEELEKARSQQNSRVASFSSNQLEVNISHQHHYSAPPVPSVLSNGSDNIGIHQLTEENEITLLEYMNSPTHGSSADTIEPPPAFRYSTDLDPRTITPPPPPVLSTEGKLYRKRSGREYLVSRHLDIKRPAATHSTPAHSPKLLETFIDSTNSPLSLDLPQTFDLDSKAGVSVSAVLQRNASDVGTGGSASKRNAPRGVSVPPGDFLVTETFPSMTKQHVEMSRSAPLLMQTFHAVDNNNDCTMNNKELASPQLGEPLDKWKSQTLVDLSQLNLNESLPLSEDDVDVELEDNQDDSDLSSPFPPVGAEKLLRSNQEEAFPASPSAPLPRMSKAFLDKRRSGSSFDGAISPTTSDRSERLSLFLFPTESSLA